MVAVRSDADIVAVRQCGRAIAERIGMSSFESALVATALSELVRNIIDHAGSDGIVELRAVTKGRAKGIEIIARDHGPGIPDLELAMRDGYSTGGGLGVGLPGVRRLMDEFEVDSSPGRGTRITAVKWRR